MASLIVLPLLVMIVVGAIAAVAAIMKQRKQHRIEQWRLVAGQLGLNFFPSSIGHGPAMSGEISGFPVTVDVHKDSSGENTTYYTRYSVRYPSSGAPPIRLTRQHGYHSIGFLKRMLGTKDVEIGDATFDERVLIDSQDPTLAAQFLSPIRRDAVLVLFSKHRLRDAHVTEHDIVLETLEVANDAAPLARNIMDLIELGRIMSEPTEVDRALEQAHRGPIDDIAPPLAPPPVPASEPVPAEPTPQDAVLPDPAPEPVAPEPEPAPDPQPVAPDPEAAPEPVLLDAASVAAALFDSNLMGFEIDELFESSYNGQPVSWSGTVDSVRDDEVTIILTGVGNDQLRSSRVQLAADLGPDVTVERGDELTISGELRQADRFTRTLHVDNAVIE